LSSTSDSYWPSLQATATTGASATARPGAYEPQLLKRTTDSGAANDRYWGAHHAGATDTGAYESKLQKLLELREQPVITTGSNTGPTTTGATGAASIVDSPGGAIL